MFRYFPGAFLLSAAAFNEALAKCEVRDIESYAASVASAHKADALERLDKSYCLSSAISVEVEHSIAGGQPEKAKVSSHEGIKIWLRKRRSGGFSTPDSWPFVACRAGICNFEGSQLHNHLFLKEIHYRATPDGAVISKVVFEDGD